MSRGGPADAGAGQRGPAFRRKLSSLAPTRPRRNPGVRPLPPPLPSEPVTAPIATRLYQLHTADGTRDVELRLYRPEPLDAPAGDHRCRVEITGLPAAARDLGIVFQSYALFPHLTVARNAASAADSQPRYAA